MCRNDETSTTPSLPPSLPPSLSPSLPPRSYLHVNFALPLPVVDVPTALGQRLHRPLLKAALEEPLHGAGGREGGKEGEWVILIRRGGGREGGRREGR